MDFASSPFFNLNLAPNWITFVLLLLILPGLGFILWFCFKRTTSRVVLLATETLFFLCWGFGLNWMAAVCLVAFATEVIVFYLINPGENRLFFANNMTGKGMKIDWFGKKKKQGEVLYNRDAVFQAVVDACLYMSKRKIGALITFEKHDPLDQWMARGTMLNAPVVPELLETIFYEGTRLHDGAVVIRNDKIAAAAVFFDPTTKAMEGKFGARHRAAQGVSEVTDSVTIVVSEETGNVGIAYRGEFHNVDPDQLLSILTNDMAIEENPVEEEKD